jgi:hypothetical protein
MSDMMTNMYGYGRSPFAGRGMGRMGGYGRQPMMGNMFGGNYGRTPIQPPMMGQPMPATTPMAPMTPSLQQYATQLYGGLTPMNMQ